MDANSAAWAVWLASATPETGDVPGDMRGATALQRLVLLRILRPDRVIEGLRTSIAARLGQRFVVQEPHDLVQIFGDSTSSTPLLFVLFPGVDPGAEIEELGNKLGFSAKKERYVSVSMGQGQESFAERMLHHHAREGGWVFLQNVHLMESWLPRLEKVLEQVAETGHSDFRCFLSAEPPAFPHMQTIPESILQSAVKIANEPPTDIKANMQAALGTIGERFFESSTKPEVFKPIVFALAFFHALVLGRRRFGSLGFSRPYPFSGGDFSACASVVKNYVEARDVVPWSDLRYIIGDIMYGGHVTDAWDRRCSATYLDHLLDSKLLEKKTDFLLAPGFRAFAHGTFADARAHVDHGPADSPLLFGLHTNADLSLLIAEADDVCEGVRELSAEGTSSSASSGTAAAARESKMQSTLTELQMKLPFSRSSQDIRAKAADMSAPYTIFLVQEVERLNHLVSEIKRSLAELELGLAGALNMSPAMDILAGHLHANTVPDEWLRACGQMGPTGSYNRRPLSTWYADLMQRDRHLVDWGKDPNGRPPSVWISGLYNPMGFVTACLQITARGKGLALDSMTVSTSVLPLFQDQVTEQPEEGAYVHGLFIEGARWDVESACIMHSFHKELHSSMPVIHLKGVTAKEQTKVAQQSNVYMCPVYMTTARGPTYQFTSHLPSSLPTSVWTLAGVCLLMQAV